MKCKMEHSHRSGESWYFSVFLQIAFKRCSKKGQVLHTTLWYGTSAWGCCDCCCCSCFRLPELWLVFPTFDLKSTASFHQRKPFPHQQTIKMAKASTKRNGGKNGTGFLEFPLVPFPTVSSLTPSHVWVAQCIHYLVQWTKTPLVLVKFGIDFTSINKSLSISFECYGTSEKEARVQYAKAFLVIH